MRKGIRPPTGFFSYIAALLLTVFFALYLSGRTGWFIFAVMAILPAVSALTAFFMRRAVSISAEVSETEVYKNTTVKVRITVKNRAYLPTPPVEIILSDSEALGCDIPDGKLILNVMPRSEQTAEAEFTAKIWCAAFAGAERAIMADYTGNFSFKLKSGTAPLSFKINIIPDITDVQTSDGLLKNVNEAAAQNDDSEESRETASMAFNGTPGYEHREYVSGDPIKRINWKLSCKRDEYMVRLDDEILSSRHTIVLDRVNSGKVSDGEVCGEYMLGMLRVMARSGMEADVWYFSGNQWQNKAVADEGDVEQLRFALAGYGFSEDCEERVPIDEIKENGKSVSLLFFTPCYDERLAARIQPKGSSAKTDMTVTVAAASFGENVHASNVWLLSSDGHSEIIL